MNMWPNPTGANVGGPSKLQSVRLVAAVTEFGSLKINFAAMVGLMGKEWLG